MIQKKNPVLMVQILCSKVNVWKVANGGETISITLSLPD